MPPVIRITDEIYKRLENHAQGFDTPAAVIEKLLDAVEGRKGRTTKQEIVKPSRRPELIFNPTDEKTFLVKLLQTQTALVKLHYQNGAVETHHWNASNMRRTSNLRGNIWSGYLRDWQEKGIVKAEFSVEEEK